MKTLSLSLACALLLSACASPRYQLVTPCPTKSKADIAAAFVALVTAEGLTPSIVNENVGVVQAASAEESVPWTLGMYMTKHWSLTMRADTVVLMAKTYTYQRNAFGGQTSSSETYYSDKAHEDHGWYWNVRNGIATVCENQPIIVEGK